MATSTDKLEFKRWTPPGAKAPADGSPGAAGQRGQAGPRGPEGPRGQQGFQGNPGLKGDKGDTGSSGTGGSGGFVVLDGGIATSTLLWFEPEDAGSADSLYSWCCSLDGGGA